MTEHPGTIRNIAWREIFPWLILLRTFRIAISPTLLALATAAVLLTPLGWNLAGAVFLDDEQWQELNQSPGVLEPSIPPALQTWLPDSIRVPLFDAYFELSELLARFFQLKLTISQAAYLACGFLWTLALWAFPGGLITRRAVMQLATESAPGILSSGRFAGRRWLWYFLAPLYPVLAIAGVTLPIAAVGLLLRMHTGLGVAIAGLAWIFVAILSVGALWLFGGLIFGWPLMWPAISAERDGDPFEAFSRSYSYVYGKPLHYFFYVLIAAAFGALCWTVVFAAAMIVQEFGFWALSWGGGKTTVLELKTQAFRIAAGRFEWLHDDALWKFGTTLIGLVVALVRTVADAFRFTYFFTAASAIYLLLRYHVDEKEMDEVFIELGDERPDSIRGSTPPTPSVAPAVSDAS
jgi:hypothetical protein